MLNGDSSASWTPDYAWKMIDQVLLNAKLADIAEEMHPKLAKDKASAHAEGHKRGNSGFYPSERIRLEEHRADEWAEKTYQAALQVWKTQVNGPCPAFHRAIHKNLLVPLFGARKGAVAADMNLEDQRTRQLGRSTAAVGAFARAMDGLNISWNRKIDIAARENEYATRQEPSRSNHEILGKQWDVFVSFAGEDKDEIAGPLAESLQKEGYRVWYFPTTMTVGDSQRRSIDQGLAHSRFGVVILSKDFFRKHWPEQELNGLMSREINGTKIILPVWHGVDAEAVRNFSPMLADKLGIATD
jgi:hypothetical protein